MASREEVPKVNAGSMADIAFLLLIFFLVTTTIETEKGLDRMLPRKETSTPPPIPERNVLPILINGQDQLMVDNEVVDLKDLKELTIAFLDNGGLSRENKDYCDYCLGKRDPKSSDNPNRAIVSLMSNRGTSYGMYIAVQNELVAAYNTLRNREAQRLFNTDFTAMEALYASSETSGDVKKILRARIKRIQKRYPLKLSEAERQ